MYTCIWCVMCVGHHRKRSLLRKKDMCRTYTVGTISRCAILKCVCVPVSIIFLVFKGNWQCKKLHFFALYSCQFSTFPVSRCYGVSICICTIAYTHVMHSVWCYYRITHPKHTAWLWTLNSRRLKNAHTKKRSGRCYRTHSVCTTVQIYKYMNVCNDRYDATWFYKVNCI